MMKSLRTLTDSLYSQRLLQGYWDTIGATTGSHPDAREGHGMIMHKSQLYVFGGFARNLFNDVKVLDLANKHWTHLQRKEGAFWPKLRSHFSFCAYADNLYVFGGLGPSLSDKDKSESSSAMENASPKDCYNQMLVFNTVTQTWRKIDPANINNVKKRYAHIGATGGCIMMVHGGRNSIQREVYSDFSAFDCIEQEWVPVTVNYGRLAQGKFVEDDPLVYKSREMGSRSHHSVIAVFDNQFYAKKNL